MNRWVTAGEAERIAAALARMTGKTFATYRHPGSDWKVTAAEDATRRAYGWTNYDGVNVWTITYWAPNQMHRRALVGVWTPNSQHKISRRY